jgi:Fe2+ or Zn2+ uptake regulation protein
MRSASFHNTIEARGEDLKAYESRASSQELKILSHFRANVGRMFTPSEIHKKLFDPFVTPLTSVRRAVTNLSKAGMLRKTDIKVSGPYGMPEHCWYLPPDGKKQSQLTLFGS